LIIVEFFTHHSAKTNYLLSTANNKKGKIMKFKFHNEESPKRRFADPLEEISSKSQAIRAELRAELSKKDMIYRLASFFSRQVL